MRSGVNPRPIDLVPDAGARRGTADGTETTEIGLGVVDPERGEGSRLPPTPGSRGVRGTSTTAPSSPTPEISIPHLQA